MNGKNWPQVAVWFICLIATSSALQTTQAIDITLTYRDHGGEPGFDPGAAELRAIMNAAVADWEGIVLDDHAMSIDYWYDDLGGDTLADALPLAFDPHNRTTFGRIRFDSSRTNWFFDATPEDDTEFHTVAAGQMDQMIVRDANAAWFNGSPPETLEVGFSGFAPAGSAALNNVDALSVLRHEIGHLMTFGNVLDPFAETRDGDYDLPAMLIGGATAAVEISGPVTSLDPNDYTHIIPEQALMFPTFAGGERRDIGALDVLIGSTCVGWSEINLPRKDFLNVAGTFWDASSNWTGNRFPGADDAAAIRIPATVQLHSYDGSARTLLLSDGASLTTGTLTGGHWLRVHEEMWIEDSTTEMVAQGPDGGLHLFGPLTIEGIVRIRNRGQLVSESDVTIQPGGQLIMESTTAMQRVQVAVDFTMDDGILQLHGSDNRLQVGIDARLSGTVTAEPGTLLTVGNNLSFGDTVATTATFNGSTVVAGHHLEVSRGMLSLIGSTTTAGQLIGGIDGSATIQLRGGQLNIGGLLLGRNAGHTGELLMEADFDDPDLGTTGAATLHVGYQGTGEVIQRAGSVGRVSSLHSYPDMSLGTGTTATGLYTLEDGVVEVGQLIVGDNGTGTFTQDGGEVIVHDDLVLGAAASGVGTYHLNSGNLTVHGFSPIPARGEAPGAGSGTINIDGGTLLLPTATMNVQTLNIGRLPGTTGSFALGSRTLNVRTLRVGDDGAGVMDNSYGVINVADEMFVADGHLGELTQTGGTVTTPVLYVGRNEFASGRYTIEDGSLNVGDLYVGRSGTGALVQVGGETDVSGDIYLGYGPDSIGSYVLGGTLPLERATLSVDGTMHVGYDGSGSLELENFVDIVGTGRIVITEDHGVMGGGGNVYVPVTNNNVLLMPPNLRLRLFQPLDGHGDMLIFDNATVMLHQGGVIHGTVTNSGTLTVQEVSELHGTITGGKLSVSGVTARMNAYAPINVDELHVSGGKLTTNSPIATDSLEITGDIITSTDVNANTTLIEGTTPTHAAGRRSLGNFTIFDGRYNLRDTGLLQTAHARIYSEFVQTGGTHQASTLQLGGDPNEYWYGDPGTYQLAGGRLEVDALLIGHDVDEDGWVYAGGLLLTDPAAEVYVADRLVLGTAGTLDAAEGVEIHMTGSDLFNFSTESDCCLELSNLTLIFEGGEGVVDSFEVAGEDLGVTFNGYEANFALGALQLGGDTASGQLRLVDLFDNQLAAEANEALYVDHLLLGAGSSLDLDGLNLYYRTMVNLGATVYLGGGALIQVPEPSTFLLMLALGILAAVRMQIAGDRTVSHRASAESPGNS